MGLKEAVLKVAGRMEETCRDYGSAGVPPRIVEGFAEALKLVCEAVGEEKRPADLASLIQGMHDKGSATLQRAVTRSARQAEEQALIDGKGLGREVALCEGGPEDGSYTPVDPTMPEGARCVVGHAVYRLDSTGKLVYDEGATRKYHGGKT